MITVVGAVERLYAVMAALPKPKTFPTCDCPFCIDEEEAAILLDAPLRQLSKQFLFRYAENVFNTIGSIDDYRYFLPRLMEIAVFESEDFPYYPGLSLRKLGEANWLDWPEEQRSAVKLVVDLWFERERLTPADVFVRDWDGVNLYSWAGEDLICGLAQAGLDIESYLFQLLSAEHGDQIRCLYHFEPETGVYSAKLHNVWWPKDGVIGRPLVAFLGRQDVQALAGVTIS